MLLRKLTFRIQTQSYKLFRDIAFYLTFNLKMTETIIIWGRKSTFENKKQFIKPKTKNKKKQAKKTKKTFYSKSRPLGQLTEANDFLYRKRRLKLSIQQIKKVAIL